MLDPPLVPLMRGIGQDINECMNKELLSSYFPQAVNSLCEAFDIAPAFEVWLIFLLTERVQWPLTSS